MIDLLFWYLSVLVRSAYSFDFFEAEPSQGVCGSARRRSVDTTLTEISHNLVGGGALDAPTLTPQCLRRPGYPLV